MTERGIREGRVIGNAVNIPALQAGDGPSLEEMFGLILDRVIQLNDPWGKYTKLSRKERLEQCYLCTLERKREIAADCRVSPVVRTQVGMLFQAVAATLEHLSGDLIQSMMEVNDEGVGRALIYSGRTVLVAKSFRGGYPFPFTEDAKLMSYGLTCVREGLQSRDKYMQWQWVEWVESSEFSPDDRAVIP